MGKLYIKFDDEENSLANGLPAGVVFIDAGVFAVFSESGELPDGARLATEEELATPASVITSMSESIREIGDDLHRLFLATHSSFQTTRFNVNVEAANRIIADNYSSNQTDLAAADLQCMNLQAIAQGEGRTPQEFAAWVIEWDPASVLATGMIEAFIKRNRVALYSTPRLIDRVVQAQHLAAIKAEASTLLSSLSA